MRGYRCAWLILPGCGTPGTRLRKRWERTRAALATADVVLAVLDLSMGADEYPRRRTGASRGLSAGRTAQGLGCTPAVGDLGGSMRLGDLELDPARLIVVGNKVDLVVSVPVGTPGTAFQVAAEGSGVEELLGRPAGRRV